MNEKHSYALSWTGVCFALVGTVTQEQLLTFLSLVLTVIVHFWNGRQTKSELPKLKAELEYWKSRAYVLDSRVDQLAGEVKALKISRPTLNHESET